MENDYQMSFEEFASVMSAEELIEAKKRRGPKSGAQTPSKPSERRRGSKKNKPGSAGKKGGKITFSEKTITSLKNKVKEHNEKHKRKVTLSQLKKVYRRGAGAFSVLPDQTLLNNNVTAPAFIAFNDANLRTDSSAWCSMEGLTSGGICDCRNTVHGAYYYKHTGGDMVINEVRLNGRGPVAYEWDTGTSQKVIRVPDWSAAPYVSWPTSWTFNLGEGQLSMTVLRGDS